MREKVVFDPCNIVLWLLSFEKKHGSVWNNRTYLNFVLQNHFSTALICNCYQKNFTEHINLEPNCAIGQNISTKYNFLYLKLKMYFKHSSSFLFHIKSNIHVREENFGTVRYKFSLQESEFGFGNIYHFL